MEGFEKRVIKLRKGSIGNTEFWTEADWETQRKHVQDLIERGEYLEEYEVEVFLEPDENFDKTETPSFESNRFVILDLTDESKGESV